MLVRLHIRYDIIWIHPARLLSERNKFQSIARHAADADLLIVHDQLVNKDMYFVGEVKGYLASSFPQSLNLLIVQVVGCQKIFLSTTVVGNMNKMWITIGVECQSLLCAFIRRHYHRCLACRATKSKRVVQSYRWCVCFINSQYK